MNGKMMRGTVMLLINAAVIFSLFSIIKILLRPDMFVLSLIFSLACLLVADVVIVFGDSLAREIGPAYYTSLAAVTVLYTAITLAVVFFFFYVIPYRYYLVLNLVICALYLALCFAFYSYGKKSLITEKTADYSRQVQRGFQDDLARIEALLRDMGGENATAVEAYRKMKERVGYSTPMGRGGRTTPLDGQIHEQIGFAIAILSQRSVGEYEKLPDIFSRIQYLATQREQALIR